MLFNIDPIIVIILLTALVVYVIVYNIKKYQNKKVKYILQNDPIAQKNYTEKHQVKRLSLQQLTEISWQFLYSITEIVLKRFSREDQIRVTQIGTFLYKIGMRYQHQVSQNTVNQVLQKTTAIEKTTSRTQSR